MLKKQKKEQEQAAQSSSHSSSSKDSFMDSSSQNSDSHQTDSKEPGYFADYSRINNYLSGSEVHRRPKFKIWNYQRLKFKSTFKTNASSSSLDKPNRMSGERLSAMLHSNSAQVRPGIVVRTYRRRWATIGRERWGNHSAVPEHRLPVR